MTVAQESSGRSGRRRILRAVIVVAVTLLVLVLVAVVFLTSLPSGGDAEARVRRQLAVHGTIDRTHPVPVRIADAIIAVEDAHFYSNHGIDLQGLARAALGPIRGGGDPGGSTVTQQLAKALYPSSNSGSSAKLQELGLALKLNERYSKDQILEMYTSVEYFGHGTYGIEAASRTYFHRPASDLDWAEASMLAGLLQAPSRLDPIAHLADARERQRHVLDRLVATRMLSSANATLAYAELTTLDR